MASPNAPATFITETGGDAFDAPFEDLFAEDVGELESLVAGVTQTSQSTLLLKKRKEMREVDDALDFMKEEFRKRMDLCGERQVEFEKRKKEMAESVFKFEKFIKENESKRKRAIAKQKAEQKARKEYTEKGEKQRELLNKYVNDSKDLEKRLESLLRYQSYLDSVIAPGSNDNDFEDISEVLSRYITLQTANKDLQRHQADGEAMYDAERNRNAHLLEKAQNDILVNNSIIHEKQKANEDLKKETSDLGARIETSENVKRSTKTEYGQVVMSIKNLHQRCAASLQPGKSAPPITASGSDVSGYLQECLSYIASRVCDLKAISQGYAKYKGRTGSAAIQQAEDSSNVLGADDSTADNAYLS